MTDEEMAEEYLEKLRKEKIPFDIYEVNNQLKRAFLAGLKAGKDMNVSTKWHKVADGDLPEEEAEYLVIFESDGTRYRGLESYYPDTKEWSTICNIIAWCEIPKFKEM